MEGWAGIRMEGRKSIKIYEPLIITVVPLLRTDLLNRFSDTKLQRKLKLTNKHAAKPVGI